MRRLHLEKTRAGVLFHLQITVDMELPCWGLQQEMERASDGVNQGVACESDLLVVKNGNSQRELLSQNYGTDTGD